MACLSLRLQTLEHGNSEFIPAFQMSRYGIHVLHPNTISTRMWFYVNKIIILEVREAKMNWLQALLAVNEILLKVIPEKTEIILSLLFNSGT